MAASFHVLLTADYQPEQDHQFVSILDFFSGAGLRPKSGAIAHFFFQRNNVRVVIVFF